MELATNIFGPTMSKGDDASTSQHRLRSQILLVAAVVAVSALGSGVMIASDGNILAGLAYAVALTVALMTFYRVEYGLYTLVGAVLVFDQFHIPRIESITLEGGYFLNLKEIPFLPPFDLGVLNPLELHLLLIVVVSFLLLVVRPDMRLRPVPVWGAALVFFVSVVLSLVYGLSSGGDFLPALWEVRALGYFAVMYFLVPQIIRTTDQVRTLMGVCIVAIAFKGMQGAFRFARLGLTTGGIPTLTNHEDPLFIGTMVIFLIALLLYRAETRHRVLLLALLIPMMVGFYAAQRRAAYAALFVMLPAFFLLLPGPDRWRLFRLATPFLLVFGAYVAIFWDSESRLAGPIRLVKTGFETDRESSAERYYSNLYRDYEKYNLAMTVRNSPITGIGFGKKYDQPIKLVNIAFPLRDYIPHNEILWLMTKAGSVGFFFFWLFLNAYACRAGGVLTSCRDPYLKSVIAVALCAIVGQVVVSYYDLQLTYYRNMVYLGTLMGLLPVAISAGQPVPATSNAGVPS